jgi:diguanylate cyclase (GGDEF)-like protein
VETYKSDAFWIGTVLAVACYIFDYAWRIAALQITSYAALLVIWSTSGISINPMRSVYSALYLLISLVTFFTLNRARASLIAGQQRSQYQADTDLLTGLTMRTAAQKIIEEHLKTDEHGVMLLLDLDRFKSVNDRLGHQMGDSVLIEVAADLKKMFRNSDVLSRLGGDEFVVYMKSVPEKDWALQRAGQVVREVRRWVGNGTTNIQITASVGIVMTDMVERTYDELYRAADIAMYAAKSQGGNQALFYTPEMLEHARETENSRHLTSEKIQTETDQDALR